MSASHYKHQRKTNGGAWGRALAGDGAKHRWPFSAANQPQDVAGVSGRCRLSLHSEYRRLDLPGAVRRSRHPSSFLPAKLATSLVLCGRLGGAFEPRHFPFTDRSAVHFHCARRRRATALGLVAYHSRQLFSLRRARGAGASVAVQAAQHSRLTNSEAFDHVACKLTDRSPLTTHRCGPPSASEPRRTGGQTFDLYGQNGA